MKEEIDVVEVCTNLDEPDFITLLNFKTNILESLFNWRSQDFFPVFHRTCQMIQKQCFIVAFEDVVTHPRMLHLREPTPHATCEVSRNDDVCMLLRFGLGKVQLLPGHVAPCILFPEFRFPPLP